MSFDLLSGAWAGGGERKAQVGRKQNVEIAFRSMSRFHYAISHSRLIANVLVIAGVWLDSMAKVRSA